MNKVIDIHVHLYPPEIIEDEKEISRTEPHFDLLCHNNVHKWAVAEDLIEEMDRCGIEKSVVFGFAFQDLELCKICNDYVMDALKKYPDRLVGFAVVPPTARGSIAEIERCKQGGMSGIGEIFSQGQMADISDLRQTWRVANCCACLDMPMLVHVAEPVGHDYDGKGNVGPKEAYSFCLNHPDNKVIFAHMGGGLWAYETMPEMKLILKNAYYDLAALPFLYTPHVLEAAIASGCEDKLLYGSDFPILSLPRYTKMLDNAGISQIQKEKILYGNASKLLDL